MAAFMSLPDIAVDHQDIPNSVLNLLKYVKPEWKTGRIKQSMLSGGVLNILVLCHLHEDTSKRNAVIVRVFGGKRSKVNVNNELAGLQYAHAAGCGMAIAAIFLNGIAVEYASGQVITRMGFFDAKLRRSAARSLAMLHTFDTDSIVPIGLDGKPINISKQCGFIPFIKKYLIDTPETLMDPIQEEIWAIKVRPRVELEAELQYIEEYLYDLDFQQSFCHLDFHYLNIIYDESRDCTKLIDFEWSDFNYTSSDHVCLLKCQAIHEIFKMCGENEPKFDQQFVTEWMRVYQEEKYKLQGKAIVGDQFEGDLLKLLLEQEIMNIVFLFFMFVMFSNYIESTDLPPGALFKISLLVHEDYFSQKDKLPILKEKYLKMCDN